MPPSAPHKNRLPALFEWLVWHLSIYCLPAVISLLSLWAVLGWQPVYDSRPLQALELRTLSGLAADLPLPEARQQLASAPRQTHHDTHLSEAPVWFALQLPTMQEAETGVIEFPSRHAQRLACWDAQTLDLLGDTQDPASESAIFPVKAGYGLKPVAGTTELLCQAAFVGPARLSADWWDEAALDTSVQGFHRASGLFNGGLIVLALSIFMTALINRSALYVLFSTWLVVTLRVGAISGGWDTEWLGHAVPRDWLPHTRALTIALYALLTLTLYRTLFAQPLCNSRFAPAIVAAQWLTLPLLLAAIVLPFRHFLPVMWLFTGVGLSLMTLSLFSIVVRTRSRVAYWYAASLAVTFISSLFEILAAAYGLKELVGYSNSVTAALASSLLASLAIAEQMRQEHDQRLAVQAELQHTYDAMPIGLFTLDLQGRFTSANPAMQQMLTAHSPFTVGDVWTRHFSGESWPRLHHLVYTQKEGELEITSAAPPPAETRRYLVHAALSRGRIEGTLQDITEKHKVAEHLNFLAHHDPLTGVYNRNGIEAAFQTLLPTAYHTHPLALAYLDLDRFKLINDLYGHATGDDILRQMCQRLQRIVSSEARIGRVGGDQFVILIPDTPLSLAAVICQSLISSIASEPYRRGDKSFTVRGSIGLIEIRPGTDFKDAISTADRACRAAKDGAKGLVVYDSSSPVYLEHKAEIKLVEHLKASKTLDGLFLEMQPIMSLKRPHDSLNFEVLLRMHDAQGKRVPVGSLITAGEHSGHMGEIDRWVLSSTLAWLDAHQQQLKTTQFVCINLSGASLNDEAFLDEVFDMLERNRAITKFLSIEVTESVALTDLSNTRRFIDRVRSYGARVALDDFGAGYTSFSYLKELPADLLKIDGSFIVNMNQHPANISIVEAIVNLARNLGMKTIAEWAEDKATVQTLAEIGVDYVQGFAVARPQPPEALLTAHSSASFIQDRELADFALHLNQGEDLLAQADLFGQDNARNIH